MQKNSQKSCTESRKDITDSNMKMSYFTFKEVSANRTSSPASEEKEKNKNFPRYITVHYHTIHTLSE